MCVGVFFCNLVLHPFMAPDTSWEPSPIRLIAVPEVKLTSGLLLLS